MSDCVLMVFLGTLFTEFLTAFQSKINKISIVLNQRFINLSKKKVSDL